MITTSTPVTSSLPARHELVPLSAATAQDPALTGGKASALAALLADGFPVPPGFVVTTTATGAIAREGAVSGLLAAEIVIALERIGGCPVAVRSSAVAEDGASASFAGMYETSLDVRDLSGVLDAIARCVASADAARVRVYRGDAPRAPIAVLVQKMVAADAAGVAFTADPVTGDRRTTVVSAVRGLGERLVSGASSAEEWRARDAGLERLRDDGVLGEPDARLVVDLARRVAERAGAPRDVEWAIRRSEGRPPEILLLQARPITALPDSVRWEAPPGGWVRNFRLGEWLGDPVTPSFDSWVLADVEDALGEFFYDVCGVRLPPPAHVIVNGWYFYGLAEPGAAMLRALPRMLYKAVTRFRDLAALIPPLAHLGFDHATARWRDEILPAYEALASEALRDAATLPPAALVALVDRIGSAAGAYFGSIVGVAGYSAKVELKLALFWREHLAGVDGTYLDLVREGDALGSQAHDVQGLDWVHPVLGELGLADARPDDDTRARIVASRDATLARVREALADRPKVRARFDAIFSEARRAHRIREEQARAFTLPWPGLRKAILRLGEHLAQAGVLATREQVFFLRKDEILAALAGETGGGSRAAEAERRRTTWERQRRLAVPLVIGELPGQWAKVFAQIEDLVHGKEKAAESELRGMPGSPGSVTGRVRVLRRVDELDRLLPGEVLVATVTTPAWTPAFTRAKAVVTDTGSIASHASIVAREYGLPAVVATGDATSRLRDGDLVTVDGNRGVVRRNS